MLPASFPPTYPTQPFNPIDIAATVADLERKKQKWIAFEYFPAKTPQGMENLRERMHRMKRHKPLYIDMTWGAGGSTSETTVDLCVDAQRFGLTANMHLTCTNMPREKLDIALRECEKQGIVNLLALRGDPPVGQVDFKPVETGFSCALDLIQYLSKSTKEKKLSISCAGYPEGHPQRIKLASSLGRSLTPAEVARASTDLTTGEVWVCPDDEFVKEIDYLKQKIDAGAGMIVTQLFYDPQVYIAFVKACREHGITVPIVPGIMCIASLPGLKRMATSCRTRLPDSLRNDLRMLEVESTDVMREYGIRYGASLCQAVLDSGLCSGLHFYTLNQDELVDGILRLLEWPSLPKREY